MTECPNCGEEIDETPLVCPMCGFTLPHSEECEEEILEAIGAATKHRFFAAIADNGLALITAFAVASQMEFLGELQQGLSAYGLYLAYYFVTEGLLGASPGKLFFRLRIECWEDGRRAGWKQAGVRTLLRIAEVNPLIGYLPAALAILVSQRHQRFGDMLAGTVVVSQD